MLTEYPLVGLILVALGLYLANYTVANKGQSAAATFLTAGLTMITAAGTASFSLASAVVSAMLLGIAVADLCQHIAHAIFPEGNAVVSPPPPQPTQGSELNWVALRATLIVFPPYLLALINPAMYLPLIMKSASLGQQDCSVSAGKMGREILGSTFLGGCLAILF